MNWNVFSDRKSHRVTMTVAALVVCGFVLLNLPYDCMQRRLWTGQVISNRSHRQLDVIRKNIAVPISSQGWENDHFIGRFAGCLKRSGCLPPQRYCNGALGGIETQCVLADLYGVPCCSGSCCYAEFDASILMVATSNTRLALCYARLISIVELYRNHGRVSPHGRIGSEPGTRDRCSRRIQFLNLLADTACENFACVHEPSLFELGFRYRVWVAPRIDRRISRQPSLQCLVLRECLINRQQLQQLVEHPSLEQVRFEHCHFEPGTTVASSTKWHVSELIFANCTGIENLSSTLPHAKGLRRCMIQGSLEDLQLLVTTLHRSSLEYLELVVSADLPTTPHSKQDASREIPTRAMIEINAFPVLQSLTLFDCNQTDSRGRYLISISDCNQLNRITVERSQCWDLKLAELPRLSQLVSHADRPGAFHHGGGFLARIRSLTMCGLPSICKLAIHSTHIERLQIEDCPGVQELILRGESAFSRFDQPSHENDLAGRGRTHTSLASHFAEVFGDQVWLKQLRRIDLSHNSLRGVDLRSLTQLTELKKLTLDFTDVEVNQLTSGAPHNGLQHLSLCRFDLSSADLISLLDHFPKLASTRFYPAQVETLVLKDRPELQSIGLGTEITAQSVQITNCPKLCDQLRCIQPLKKLHIRNVPELRSLAVDYPVPQDTVFEGLRRLTHVDLSGEFLTDQHLKEISMCHPLESLSFDAPNVSPAALRRIGSLKNLSVLSLPHTQLNDEAVRAWGPLPLFELDLAQTSLTERSLVTLLQSQSLRRISLRHTRVSGQSLEVIQNLPRLYWLDMTGVQIDARSLASLLQGLKLDCLDLSETHLSKDMIDVLCSSVGENVTTLVLHGCDVSPEDIQRIVDTHSRLVIETSTASVSASFPLVQL